MKLRFTSLMVLAVAVLFMVSQFTFAQNLSVARKQPGNSTALSLATGDPGRASVSIENVGSVNVSVSNSSSVTTTTGIVVTPSQQLLCVGITDAFYGIAASGTGDLRVTTATQPTGVPRSGMPYCSVSQRLSTTGITNTAAANTIPMSDGTNVVTGNVLFNTVTSAITPNSTSNSDTAGTLAVTSNSTGKGTIYRSDGSLYQLLSVYSDATIGETLPTVTTTGNTDVYILAPFAGTVTGVDFSGVDALATDNTNYVTFSITNLGQAGSGTNPILAATDANTTKTTGGSAVSANTKRSLTVNGTGSNLIVAKGDRLRVRVAASGTLANTITFGSIRIYLTRLS